MAGGRYGIGVRAAIAADAVEIARLLRGEGVRADPAAVSLRLEARDRASEAILVAEGWGGLAGLVELRWAAELAHSRPLARITAMIVDPEERRRGIGRVLLKAASQAARAAGCDQVTMAPGGEAGRAFCHACGFDERAAVWGRPLRRGAA